MTCVFWIVLGLRLDLEQQQPPNDEATAVQEPAGWMLFVLPCDIDRVFWPKRGRGELGTNKNLDLWFQLVCTKLKLKHAI